MFGWKVAHMHGETELLQGLLAARTAGQAVSAAAGRPRRLPHSYNCRNSARWVPVKAGGGEIGRLMRAMSVGEQHGHRAEATTINHRGRKVS